MKAAKEAGALFGVSPGITDELVAACEAEELPLLGGIATVSEAMRMLARGYSVCKFFPAEANGGAPALKSFAGPLPQMSFCPTGGVTPKNAPDYLALPNVLCVGGSWVCDPSLPERRRVGRRSNGWPATPASSRGETMSDAIWRELAEVGKAAREVPHPRPLPATTRAASRPSRSGSATCCSTSRRPPSTPAR